jgi:hypothetical protein
MRTQFIKIAVIKNQCFYFFNAYEKTLENHHRYCRARGSRLWRQIILL